MKVTTNNRVVFWLLDTLLERWRATPKRFPYQHKEAVIPQTIVPEKIRDDKEALALFYFYICIYMRGGIESIQVFRAYLKMWDLYPHLFNPLEAQWMNPEDIQPILKQHIGWDSNVAAKNWVINSRRLMSNYNGSALVLLKGLRSYDEALRRMRNKLRKGDLKESWTADCNGEGFRGWQHKMVSMYIYFCDWEGLLEKRFLFPAPADFHNFRLGLATGALIITPFPERGWVRFSEKLSKPWRTAVMRYLKARNADPVEVADALWLFSLVMCANSPLTNTTTNDYVYEKLIFNELPKHVKEEGLSSSGGFKKAVSQTCLRCPFLEKCNMAIPSRDYYTLGRFLLRTRPRVEDRFGKLPSEYSTASATENSVQEQVEFFSDLPDQLKPPPPTRLVDIKS